MTPDEIRKGMLVCALLAIIFGLLAWAVLFGTRPPNTTCILQKNGMVLAYRGPTAAERERGTEVRCEEVDS